MKLSLIITFSLFCARSFSQNGDEQAIKLVMQQQVDAWNKGDIKGFMQTYWQSDSLMFIGSKGITYGWDSTLQHYKNAYPDKAAMGTLSFELKQLRQLSDNYYFIVGKFLLARKKGNLSGYFSLLLMKTNGTWLITADHTS